MSDEKPKSKKGFASMDPARHRELASKGGKTAHEKGTAHKYSSAEARVYGKKGGHNVSRNREHMAAIGRLGGKNKEKKRQEQIAEAKRSSE